MERNKGSGDSENGEQNLKFLYSGKINNNLKIHLHLLEIKKNMELSYANSV